MKIKRDGIEIELTKDELFLAAMEWKYINTRDWANQILENEGFDFFVKYDEFENREDFYKIINDTAFREEVTDLICYYRDKEYYFDSEEEMFYNALKNAFCDWVMTNGFHWFFKDGIHIAKESADLEEMFSLEPRFVVCKGGEILGYVHVKNKVNERFLILNICSGIKPQIDSEE